MIFFVLLLSLLFSLIFFAVWIDKNHPAEINHVFINLSLLLIYIVVDICFMLICSYLRNRPMQSLLGKLLLFVFGAFLINLSGFCIRFPRSGKDGVFSRRVRKLVLYLLLAYISFIGVEDIYFSRPGELQIISGSAGGIPFIWMSIYAGLYVFFLPAVSQVSLLGRLLFEKSRINRQKMLAVFAGLLLSQILSVLFFHAISVIPYFTVLYPVVPALFVLIAYFAVSMPSVIGFRQLCSKIFEVICFYILPACAAGLLYTLLHPVRQISVWLFLALILPAVFVLALINYYAGRFLRKKTNIRTVNYLRQFEKNLVGIDYGGEPQDVLSSFGAVVCDALDAVSVSVLIDFGEGALETVYSFGGFSDTLPIDGKTADVVLNTRIRVILHSQVETLRGLEPIRSELKAMFAKTEAEVCIILNEGRRVFGAILIGRKKLGNIYTNYDYDTFTALYSYFFIIGYYVRNIANKKIVSTVNREIKMSGQVIRFIQQKMDFIQNPCFDVGYRFVPAREIGSEILDFIRLTDTRSLFIVGAISGKGLTSSIIMVMMKSLIRTFLGETRDFRELVQKINQYIRFELPRGTFFSGVFGIIDFSSGIVYYINCGIPAMFLYTQVYNNVTEIQGEGRILGFVKDIKPYLRVRKIYVNPGDLLFTCTSGIIGLRSVRGESFGKDRLQKIISANLHYPANKIVSFVFDEAIDFISQPLETDISILAIKGVCGKG